MRVRLITDRPEHPVLAEMLALLDAEPLSPEADAEVELAHAADLYLLKSHAPVALALAGRLEDAGHRVVNSVAATAVCLDRLRMARRLEEAVILAPRVLYTGALEGLRRSVGVAGSGRDRFPVMVKSRASRRGDLVALVRSEAELSVLCHDWAHEEVVAQEHLPNDGWDVKLWVVADRVFAARRPTPLDPNGEPQTLPIEELPREWTRLVEMVRHAFSLDLFGVDLLQAELGPAVVDVNAFPGFRGVPGAVAALVAFVTTLVTTTSDSGVSTPTEITLLNSPVRIHAIRRKPGKGLVVVAEEQRTGRSSRSAAAARWQVTVDERTLLRRGVGETLDGVLAQLDGSSIAGDFAAAVQPVGDDAGLPALRAALDVTPGTHLWRALSGAAASQGEELDAVVAEPARHKPGSRCLIAYRLSMRGSQGRRRQTVYGKLFAHLAEAVALDATLRRLQGGAMGPAWTLPAPLGVVEPLGLALIGDAAPAGAAGGVQALRPERVHTRQGRRTGGRVPAETLDTVATGLARLHHGGLSAAGLPERPASGEADRARMRGELLAGHAPELADSIRTAAGAVVDALLEHSSVQPRVCHGGFKPAQLLVAPDGQVAVTDWDGACAADPALDLGYFCAYLRPPSLWTEAAGARSWFVAARERLRDAYAAEARRLGVGTADLVGLRGRAAIYEAALLLKIATRRVNRLNSPRPAELAAMCAEMRRCLAEAGDVADVA
jgi:glutathione synthase/RimK-type ligase-like ATP-grasp enzyme